MNGYVASSPSLGARPLFINDALNNKGILSYIKGQYSVVPSFPIHRGGFSAFLLYFPIQQNVSSPMIQAQSTLTAENFYFLSSYYPSLLNNYSVTQINNNSDTVAKFRQGFQLTVQNTWQLIEFISIDGTNADFITTGDSTSI